MAVKFYQSENQVPLEMHKVRMIQKAGTNLIGGQSVVLYLLASVRGENASG